MPAEGSRRRMRAVRVAALVVVAGVGAWFLGEYADVWPSPAPAADASTPQPTFTTPGTIYEYGYWGGVKNRTSGQAVQWVGHGGAFAMTTGGSGLCLNEPVGLEVVAPDHLRVEVRLDQDETGCSESLTLATFVLDTPPGLDPTRIVRVERHQTGQAGTSSDYVGPLPQPDHTSN